MVNFLSVVPFVTFCFGVFSLSRVLTLPASSSRRPAAFAKALPFLIATPVLTCFGVPDSSPLNLFFGVHLGTIFILDSLDMACWTRMQTEDQTIWGAFFWTLKRAFGKRRIGTRYQISKIPPFSSDDPDFVPSRESFLLSRLVRLGFAYLVFDLIANLPIQSRDEHISAARELLFSRMVAGQVTLKELGIRASIVLAFWIGVYAVQLISYEFFSILAVGSGISKPADWPPRFGSISECYSIRGFWGDFWHQELRTALTSTSSFLVNDVLQIPKGFLARYSKITITFILSGLVHVHLDSLLGVEPLHFEGPMFFFILQACAIMLEDCVRKVYNRMKGNQRLSTKREEMVPWQRIFGFIWVTIFLTYSTPFWAYASMRMEREPAVNARVFAFLNTKS